MTVASGQMPYQYDWPTPFHVRSHQDSGLSGVHLEAAQFVIQAELRKFQLPDATYTTRWKVYTNEAIPAGSGYDPKPRGETLNGLVGPAVAVDLDHIGLMRALMFQGIFRNGYDLCEYDSTQLLEDWIRRAYPASPSGYGHDILDGQFLRPILQDGGFTYIPSVTSPNALTGTFTDPDPHWLGGSGIILDIDVGEVMWNPYPTTFVQIAFDSHGRADDWTITARPLYPSFQKTDGSIISLNGFENKWPQDPITSSYVNQYGPVGSGFVRFTAYPILTNTQIYFGRINDELSESEKMQFSTDITSVVADSARPLGAATRNVQHTDGFFTPIPLGTGLYRVAARNRKVDFPFTTVESGVVSQWPSINNFQLHIAGHEVFNNCFWITDWGTRAGGAGPAGPSGFVVVSPFTSRVLWQRNATDDVGGQVFDLGTSTLKDVRWWFNSANTTTQPYLSLQRTGTNSIVRLVGNTEGSVFPTGTSILGSVAIYNDNIASVVNQSISFSLPTGVFGAIFNNMVFDGTFYWVGGTVAGGASKTWKLDNSFVEVERFNDRIGTTHAGYISDGLGGSLKFVGFGAGNSIREYSIGAATGGAPETSQFNLIATKSLNPPTGMSTVLEIYALIEVSGVPELQNGVYAYILARNAANTARRLYIVRITEGATTWSPVEERILRTVDNAYDPPITSMGMIVMPVN